MTAEDPLGPLLELPGVAKASQQARDALSEAHRHPFNRHGWPETAVEAAIRAARASSALDGGAPRFAGEGLASGPILAGALRVAEALEAGQSSLVSVCVLPNPRGSVCLSPPGSTLPGTSTRPRLLHRKLASASQTGPAFLKPSAEGVLRSGH